MHKIYYKNSKEMGELETNSVDLVVTSPPYPMIEMWDELFGKENLEISKALKEGHGNVAFWLMHEELEKVWNEVQRVLKKGGIACINIGDAVRSLRGNFQLYPNHSMVINYFMNNGFSCLPDILWVKETNKPNKFMGSGMLPVGAYVTLEHEYILIFRKGERRKFQTEQEKISRKKSALFWEERNVWFSDLWRDINGKSQKLNHKSIRNRSASFPLELVYRLVNMFSLQGDTVLDPFAGTGTTILASMLAGRNSIAYEIDTNFKEVIEEGIDKLRSTGNNYIDRRLENHIEFVEEQTRLGKEFSYRNKYYNFRVKTRQEVDMIIPYIGMVEKVSEGLFEVELINRPVQLSLL